MTFTSHKYYYPKKSNSIPISIFIYNFACHRFHHLPIHIKSISVTDYSSTFVFSDLTSVLPANRYKSAVAQLTTSCIMEFFTPVICNAFIHFNWPHSHSKNGHCFYTMPIPATYYFFRLFDFLRHNIINYLISMLVVYDVS